MAAYLAIEDVVKDFSGTKAVNHVSLDIGKGEIFALLGSSGCGKTSSLRMIAGFEDVSSGAIRAGECIVSGGSVRAGAGFSLYAGLSARRDAWPSCGRVVSRMRPENLLSGFWDRAPCGASA